MGRFKINGLFFLKVRGFFDNDNGNLHYQTKPGKQLCLLSFSSDLLKSWFCPIVSSVQVQVQVQVKVR